MQSFNKHLLDVKLACRYWSLGSKPSRPGLFSPRMKKTGTVMHRKLKKIMRQREGGEVELSFSSAGLCSRNIEGAASTKILRKRCWQEHKEASVATVEHGDRSKASITTGAGSQDL